MKKLRNASAIVALACLVALGGLTAAIATPPPGPPGKDPCSHGNSGRDCRPDPQPGHGQDCDEHGKGGRNEDHCPDSTTTETTTSSSTTTTETTTSTGSTTDSSSTTTSSSISTVTESQPTETTTSSTTTTDRTTTSSEPAAPTSTKLPPAIVKIPGGSAARGHVPPIVHGHAVIRGSG